MKNLKQKIAEPESEPLNLAPELAFLIPEAVASHECAGNFAWKIATSKHPVSPFAFLLFHNLSASPLILESFPFLSIILTPISAVFLKFAHQLFFLIFLLKQLH